MKDNLEDWFYFGAVVAAMITGVAATIIGHFS